MVDEERPLIEHVIELVERLRISLYALICSIVLVYILLSGSSKQEQNKKTPKQGNL